MGRPGPKLSALTLFSNSHQPRSLLIAVRVDRAAHFYIIQDSCNLRLTRSAVALAVGLCDSEHGDDLRLVSARHTCDRSNSNLKTKCGGRPEVP